MAFTHASLAYSHNKQTKQALIYADKTIAVTEEKDVENGSGPPGAYVNRAQVEAAAGDLPRASDDLTKAEDLAHGVLERMASRGQEEAKQAYSRWLKGIFTYHAQILSALGKGNEAAAKTAEAAKL